MIVLLEIGAGNEVRTRGLDLGKVALYQLSYTRFKSVTAIKVHSCPNDQSNMASPRGVEPLLPG